MDVVFFNNNPHCELTSQVDELAKIKLTNPLVKRVTHLDYDVDLDWDKSLLLVMATGVINFTLIATDGTTGKEFEFSDSIEWNDQYSFNNTINDSTNIIIGQEFDILNYVLEQININLPFNLSVSSDIINKIGFGWSLVSEENYDQSEQDKLDPRWDKLSEFKKS